MAAEEHGGRASVIGSALFFAGFTWFVLNLHALVTRYLYLFSLSWYPFLAIVPPFLYPIVRRLAPVMRAMVVPSVVLAGGIAARILVSFFPLGQYAVVDDVALLASLSSFLMLSCAYFDLRSLRTASAASFSRQDDELGSIADLVAPMLASAACFAVGGTLVSLEPVLAGLLLFASIVARREAKVPAGSGASRIPSFTARRPAKEGLPLLVHGTSSTYLAFIACFLGGLVLPRTSLLSGSPMDGATWRLVLVSVLSVSTGLAIVMGMKAGARPSGARGSTGVGPWFHTALAVAIFTSTGILTVATFAGPTAAVQAASAILIVPAFHLAQAARRVPNSRIHGAAPPLQCAWNGVLASLLLGVGSIVLALLIRVGMAVEMAVVACVALVCAVRLEVGLQAVMRGKSPGA